MALASNGLHTNGYTLVRALLDRQPDLLTADVAGEILPRSGAQAPYLLLAGRARPFYRL